MSAPKFSSKSPTIRRILKEAAELSSSPSPDYTAAPLESDLFEWHFTFRGPPNSPYADGIYHGRIVLPPTYPLRPPSFRFATPSGRFEVNREICLSISGHHEETWQPAWGARTALVALRSFMETDARGQLGGLESSDATRQRHAAASHGYRCTSCGKTNLEIIQECEEAAKANEGTAGSADVEIPSELKMGWKDELGKSSGGASSKPHIEDKDPEADQLAEGFVRTAPPPEQTPLGESSTGTPAPTISQPVAAQPGSLPTPSATANVPTYVPARTVTLPPAPNLRPAPVHRATDDAVPVWIDRAIVVIVVLLIALTLRAFVEV